MSTTHPNKVCLLLKSQDGLKQAPHVWNKEINLHLCQHGYMPTNTDPCIYIHHVNTTHSHYNRPATLTQFSCGLQACAHADDCWFISFQA
jgi:hypothetical protein